MDALIIKEDEGTPKIVLDKNNNRFELSGNSLPEDIIGFYRPVYKWIEEYSKQPNQSTKLVIKLNYFNSSSSKAVLDIINSMADPDMRPSVFFYLPEGKFEQMKTERPAASFLILIKTVK